MLDLLLALALIALVAALVNAVLPGRGEDADDEGGRATQELGVAIEIPWVAIASGAITAMALLFVDLPLSIVLAVAFLVGMVCHVALRASRRAARWPSSSPWRFARPRRGIAPVRGGARREPRHRGRGVAGSSGRHALRALRPAPPR